MLTEKGNRNVNALGTKKRACARSGAQCLREFLILPFFIFFALFSDVTFVCNMMVHVTTLKK